MNEFKELIKKIEQLKQKYSAEHKLIQLELGYEISDNQFFYELSTKYDDGSHDESLSLTLEQFQALKDLLATQQFKEDFDEMVTK